MNVKVVFKNEQDRNLLDLSNLEIPFFVDYINLNTAKGKKEGWKLLNYYGTNKTPFVEIQLDEEKVFPFYSENGNAIYQLINYLNNECKD